MLWRYSFNYSQSRWYIKNNDSVSHQPRLKTSCCRCKSMLHNFNDIFSTTPARLNTETTMAIGMSHLNCLLFISWSYKITSNCQYDMYLYLSMIFRLLIISFSIRTPPIRDGRKPTLYFTISNGFSFNSGHNANVFCRIILLVSASGNGLLL